MIAWSDPVIAIINIIKIIINNKVNNCSLLVAVISREFRVIEF